LEDRPALEQRLQGESAKYKGVNSFRGSPDFYRMAEAGMAGDTPIRLHKAR
jgi:hypothetical protein